jgi:hypothetical protein
VVILFILTQVFSRINVPFPLYRLYVLCASAVILYLIWRWLRQGFEAGEGLIFRILLFGGAFFFGLIALLQLIGKADLATYLYESAIHLVWLFPACLAGPAGGSRRTVFRQAG